MHRNLGALLSMPSVEVLQQKEIAEAVSRDALSLLEGEEHPVIAVSGGQIAPLCLAHILDKMSPERTITVVLTDERYGVDVSAQNAVQLRSITSTSGRSGKLNFLAPSTSKPSDQCLRDFQVLLSSIATPVLALLGVGIDGHVASIFPSQSSMNHQHATLVNDAPGEFPKRITMTMDYLKRIPHRWTLIVGAEKQPIVQRLTLESELPVNQVCPTRWFIDESALTTEYQTKANI